MILASVVLHIDLPGKTLENMSRSFVGETAMNQTKPPVLSTGFLTATRIAANTDWQRWHGSDRIDLSSDADLLKGWCKEGPASVWSASGFGLYIRGTNLCNA
jgi:hypothetical protein